MPCGPIFAGTDGEATTNGYLPNCVNASIPSQTPDHDTIPWPGARFNLVHQLYVRAAEECP